MTTNFPESFDTIITDTFINIPKDLGDYEVRKIVYNNTLSYLKVALLRTPEDKHHYIYAGYSTDMERIISYCQEYLGRSDSELSEEFIQ